jgi:hypothetical protein
MMVFFAGLLAGVCLAFLLSTAVALYVVRR